MDHSEFYKDNYYKEFEVEEKLEKSASTSIIILVIVGGIISFLFNGIKNTNHNTCYYIFVVLFSLGGLSFLVSIYFSIRSIFNYLYMYLPTTYDLKNYYEELINYYSGDVDGDIKAKNEYEEYIISQYIHNQRINFQNNSKKSKYIHLTKKALVISVALMFLSAIPYFLENINQTSSQKVEIVNWKDFKIVGDSTMSKESSPKPATTVPKPKPTPPPSIGRKDGNIGRPPLPPKKK